MTNTKKPPPPFPMSDPQKAQDYELSLISELWAKKAFLTFIFLANVFTSLSCTPIKKPQTLRPSANPTFKKTKVFANANSQSGLVQVVETKNKRLFLVGHKGSPLHPAKILGKWLKNRNSKIKQTKISKRNIELKRNKCLDLEFHLWFLGATFAAWGALEIVKYTAGPKHCRWCDRDENGYSTLNRLDRQMRAVFRASPAQQVHAKRGSDALAFVGIPLAGALSAFLFSLEAPRKKGEDSQESFYHRGSFWRMLTENSILLAEAAAMSSLLYQIIALSAARQRPYAHADFDPQAKPWNNISFCSGHTSIAFALVTATGTIATMRRYPWRGWVWTVGIPAAIATGALRIAADRHYFTDVLAGAILGTLVGFAVPALSLKGKVVPLPSVGRNAASIGVGGRF